jgi:hypothetical protein
MKVQPGQISEPSVVAALTLDEAQKLLAAAPVIAELAGEIAKMLTPQEPKHAAKDPEPEANEG